MIELAPGLIHHPGYLDAAAQDALASDLAAVLREAPPFTPVMPRTGRGLIYFKAVKRVKIQ